jgi:hypothetical protein
MDERYRIARRIAAGAKQRMWDWLQRDSNITGAAFGRRIVNGTAEDEPALVIYVARKVPPQFLPASRLLPRRVYVGSDSVELDVVETGPFYPMAFTSNVRPSPSGISIGRALDNPIDAGTLGCLVTDNTDGTLCIVSCNHVLANENAAQAGDVIIQPGSIDGGSSPADNIATLKRFVTINASGNTVDCAIAQVDDQTLGDTVINQMMNNLMPVPSSDHPAVGLLFAGACNRTLLNPMASVLNQLNVQFLNDGKATAMAEVGMAVEKVGRTTEYTTADVSEIDVSATINYAFGNATFDNQIATAYLSQPGDSGSVVCQGGKGGTADNCGCSSTSSTSSVIDEPDLSIDQAVVEEFRDRHLRHTRTGQYIVDLFAENEERLNARVRRTAITEEDRAFFRRLYHRHVHEIRMALLQPDRQDFRFTEEHLRDAREAVARASRHMSEDERVAAERLLEIAAAANGKTVGDVLNMLNDQNLRDRIVGILSGVRFLRQPPRRDR